MRVVRDPGEVDVDAHLDVHVHVDVHAVPADPDRHVRTGADTGLDDRPVRVPAVLRRRWAGDGRTAQQGAERGHSGGRAGQPGPSPAQAGG